jgi:Acetyltransferase (GNAT) domain
MTLVTLRRSNLGDVADLHRWRSESSTGRYQPIRLLPIAELESMVLQRGATPLGPATIGTLQWTVMAAGVRVGWMTLDIDPNGRPHGVGVIGYTIGEQFRARGFGRAAVAALLPIAFAPDLLNLERLEAVAAVDNVASRRVLEGNGFQYEGTRRGLLVIGGVRVDHAMYGLLRTDWETR